MRDDLRTPLDELQRTCGQSIVSQLLAIQKCKKQQLRSFDWAKTLNCLSPYPDQVDATPRHQYDKVLHTIQIPIAARNYVAVSYRCDDATGSYRILSSDGNGHRLSHIRDTVFERILQYMATFDVGCFWIDKECVDQQNLVVLDEAVQSMDLVYRCSNHAIGLLEMRIEKQNQLDILLELISGRLVLTKRPQLKRYVDYLKARRVLRVLDALTSDPWWTRRWIFQEEYCSNMNLMLAYSEGLSTQNWDTGAVCVLGELLINASDLREQATLFCLACLHSAIFETEKEWTTCNRVLGRAKSYKISQIQQVAFDRSAPGRPMSSQILNDVSYRYASVQSDTLAVLANCCGYDALIHTNQLELNGLHSLSLAALTLCLLNGEILWDEKRVSSRVNTVSFLRRQAFDKFNPPVSKGKLSFMRKCRLPNVHLLADGIRTTGHLWHIKQRISPRKINLYTPDDLASYSDSSSNSTVSDTFTLSNLSQALRKAYPTLSRNLHSYTTDTAPSHIPSDRLHEVFDQTATHLANAITNNEDLLIVQHTTQRSRYGIFVANFPRSMRQKPVFVFTAMQAAEYSEEVEMHRSPDKYVTLTVNEHGWTESGMRLLSVHGWVNGLVFPGSTPEKEVVFRWPELLREKKDEARPGN